MSLAYKCDLCNNFVTNESEAQRERVVAQEQATVSNTVTTMTLKLDLGKIHVCNKCFNIGLKKAKAWVQAHI